MRELSAVLIYPNTNDVAFASLGFLKVFEMLKERVRLADFSFLPDFGAGRPGKRARTGRRFHSRRGRAGRASSAVLSPKQGLLLGFLSGNPVKSFDLICFSISYENDYVHVAELLARAGIPILASERPALFPLVVCGGFTMTLNPEPLADIADVAVVGEAECVLDDLLGGVGGGCAGGTDGRGGAAAKAEVLGRLARIDGIYVPSAPRPRVRRVWAPACDIAAEPPAQAPSHFGKMLLVEVGRGCGRGCFFCAAGNLYRPVRMREAEEILERSRGAEKVGLLGTAVGDHLGLEGMLREITARGCEVSVSSFRADEITRGIADLLVAGGMKTIAIAPEAGSEPLRRRINKRLSDDQIVEAVSVLASAGMKTIKLYFMIGLPGEEDADVEAAVDLVKRLSNVRGSSRLSIAAGPFVPKPQTAFQWSPFAPLATLRRRAAVLSAVRRIRGCSLTLGSLDEAWLEAVLARGDRSLGGLIADSALKGIPFAKLLKQRPDLDPTRGLDTAKPLPWDFIDSGVSKKRLEADLARSRRG